MEADRDNAENEDVEDYVVGVADVDAVAGAVGVALVLPLNAV